MMLCVLIDWFDFVWVIGNYDVGGVIDLCGGWIVEEVVVEGIVLCYEVNWYEIRLEMLGYFYLKLCVMLCGCNVVW